MLYGRVRSVRKIPGDVARGLRKCGTNRTPIVCIQDAFSIIDDTMYFYKNRNVRKNSTIVSFALFAQGENFSYLSYFITHW